MVTDLSARVTVQLDFDSGHKDVICDAAALVTSVAYIRVCELQCWMAGVQHSLVIFLFIRT